MQKETKKIKRLIIFAVCYLSYTAIYIARMNLSIASVDLTTEGVLTASRIGVLGTVFAVIYAAGRLLNGHIGDKLHPSVHIIVGLLLTAVCNVVLTALPPYAVFVLLWGVNAFGQSMLWGAILRVVAEVYPERKAKKVSSYMVTSVAFGNVIGILVNTVIVKNCGLRYAFLIPGVIVAACFVFALIFITRVSVAKTSECEKSHVLTFKEVFAERQVRRICLPVFIHGIIKDNVSFWMTLFYASEYGIDLSEIAVFIVFIPLVGLLGRLIFPVLYKVMKENEHYVSVAAYAICFVACVILVLLKSMAVSAVCLGLVYASLSIVNTAALSIFPLRFSKRGGIATISGIMDLFAYLGYGAGSLVFGYVIEPFGFTPIFAAWAALSVIALVLTVPLAKNEKKEYNKGKINDSEGENE